MSSFIHYANDPLFGNGGFFFIPLETFEARNILNTIFFFDLERDFSSSKDFINHYFESLSGAENEILWLVDNQRAICHEGYLDEPPIYDIINPLDEQMVEDARLRYIPKKALIQDWPLEMLIMSAIFRDFIDKSCPAQSRYWDISLTQTGQVIDLENLPLKNVYLQEKVEIKSIDYLFWYTLIREIFFNFYSPKLAVKVLREFEHFTKRHQGFKKELPNLSQATLEQVKLIIEALVYQKRYNPANFAFYSLQSITLFRILNINELEMQRALCLSMEQQSVQPLKNLLEKTFGPIYE